LEGPYAREVTTSKGGGGRTTTDLYRESKRHRSLPPDRNKIQKNTRGKKGNVDFKGVHRQKYGVEASPIKSGRGGKKKKGAIRLNKSVPRPCITGLIVSLNAYPHRE